MSIECMKICLAIPSLQAGGMERVMSEIAWDFSKREDVELHLLMFGREREIFYDIPRTIIIHKPHFKFNNRFRTFSTIRTILYIRKEIKKIDPDRILSFGNYWNNLILLACFGLKYPVYVSDRSKPNKNMGKVQNWLRIKLYPKAAGIIAQTQKAKEIYSEMYKNDNMIVIGNPIRKLELPDNIEREKIILSIGRLINTKHYDRLINIFAEINDPEWKLIIIGGDALKLRNSEKYKTQIKNLGFCDRIILTGTLKCVEKYLFRSSFFVFPSSSEGFPNVIGEAMSAGLPVISYDCVAGPSDMIENGKNGFLIPVFDDEKMKEKMIYLMNHEEKRNEMGNDAIRAIRKFDNKEICQKFFDFITKKC